MRTGMRSYPVDIGFFICKNEMKRRLPAMQGKTATVSLFGETSAKTVMLFKQQLHSMGGRSRVYGFLQLRILNLFNSSHSFSSSFCDS